MPGAGAVDQQLPRDRTSPAQHGIPERVVSCQGAVGRVWCGAGAVGADLPRGPSCVRPRASDEPGSRLAGGHPWKGLGLDAGEERRTLRREGRSGAPHFDGGAHAGSSPSHEKWGRQPVVRCRASLRPLGSMERCGQHQAGSSRSTTAPPGWGSRRSSSSRLGCAGPSPRLLEGGVRSSV